MLSNRLLIITLFLASTTIYAVDTTNLPSTTLQPSASTSTAAATPSACPTIADIQAAGLAKAEWDGPDNMWVVGQNNNYNLPQVWAFIIGVPTATTADQAYQLAVAGLPTLSNQPTTPVFLTPQGYWFCAYTIGNGLQAMAVTENNPYAKFFDATLKKPAQ